jgi:hypothetical protein
MCKKKRITQVSTLARQVQTYPSPKYFGLFIAYANLNEMKKSEAAAHMIRCFFDQMPEGEKIRIVNCRREINL